MLVQSLLAKYMYFQNFTNFGPVTITYVQYMYYEYINFVHNVWFVTMFTTLTFQVVAGQKFCIVTEVGISRSCRNDESHKSASLELCPVDSLEV